MVIFAKLKKNKKNPHKSEQFKKKIQKIYKNPENQKEIKNGPKVHKSQKIFKIKKSFLSKTFENIYIFVVEKKCYALSLANRGN